MAKLLFPFLPPPHTKRRLQWPLKMELRNNNKLPKLKFRAWMCVLKFEPDFQTVHLALLLIALFLCVCAVTVYAYECAREGHVLTQAEVEMLKKEREVLRTTAGRKSERWSKQQALCLSFPSPRLSLSPSLFLSLLPLSSTSRTLRSKALAKQETLLLSEEAQLLQEAQLREKGVGERDKWIGERQCTSLALSALESQHAQVSKKCVCVWVCVSVCLPRSVCLSVCVQT